MTTGTFQSGNAAQIAFVFNNVAHYDALVGAFRPDVEVHVLDATQDGLAQIAVILAGRSGVEALHVVGHGSEGSLNFGSLTLNAGSVGAYSDVLVRIGGALEPDGDILLYGCDVAAGSLGARFVGQIAQATGADIAASTDATGGDVRGGDWTLEYREGHVTHLGAIDGAAVRSLDTLLALPPAGVQDVTPTMDVGNFVPGFTLSVDPGLSFVKNDDPDGIYFYSTADQATNTKVATLTVAADNASVGSFDLTGVKWNEFSGTGSMDGAYLITVTGYKPDGTTKITTFRNERDSLNFGTADYSAFNGIVKFDVQIQAETIQGQWLYPVSNLTFDSFTIANPHAPNVAPTFLGGSALNVAQSGGAVDVSSLLHVSDVDGYQTLSWSQQTAPSHGTLSFSGATAAGGDTNITPGGTIMYTPTAGFVGTDTFAVKVDDGFGPMTKTITVTVNPVAPGALDLAPAGDSGISATDNITNAGSLSFSGTGAVGDSTSIVRVFIDENGNGAYDAGTDITGTAVMNNGAWTVSGVSTSGLTDGTYNVYGITTFGALTSALSNPLSLTLDKTASALAITSDKSSLKDGETATITFTFSEDPRATFTLADVSITGGTLSALAGTGNTRSATFTPIANNNGTASITVASGVYTDAAGNNGGAGVTPSLSFDTLAPTLAITDDKSSLKIGDTATITFSFSEDPGATFTLADIAVSGGTLGALSGSGTTRTATFTPTVGASGTASITVASGNYTDSAGNPGSVGTTSLTFDTLAPTLSIASSVATLKAGQTATITFTFSEDPGASFTAADIAVSGGTLGPLTGTGAVRSATFTPAANTDGGAASITVPGGAYTDAAGNAGAAGATPSLTFDTLVPAASSAPTLATANDLGFSNSDNLTSSTTPTFTGIAEAGATVTLYDGATVIGTGTAIGGNWSITSSSLGGGAHSITAMVTDASGNISAASGALAVTIDANAPTLAITSDVSSLKIGDTATITFTFSEDPGASFSWDGTAGDIVVIGGTLGALAGTGNTRSATFTPNANSSGTASITVASGVYTDAAGNNGGVGSTPSLSFDTLAPALSITSSAAALRTGQTATITFTFSEDPGASFTDDDIVVSGGILGALVGSGTIRTATFTPTANVNVGVASITVATGAYADAAGNGGAGGAVSSLTFDTLAPTLLITSDIAALKAGQTATISFTFSEDPGASFGDGDIVVIGGTLSALSGTGAVRTATFTPVANSNAGVASITVASGSYTDMADNNGGAGTTPTLSFDTLVPNAPSAPDLLAASDSGSSNSDNVTNVTTPTFSGTAETGTTVRLYDTDGTTVLGIAIATGGVWSITTAALATGSHTVTATATNAAGNTSSASTGLFVTVDPIGPSVASVTVPANGTYQPGQSLTFTVHIGEAVLVDTTGGMPRIELSIGSTTRYASYVSGSGTTALLFSYTVQPGESDADGITVGALSSNGGTLKDAAGNDATRTLNTVGSTALVKVDTPTDQGGRDITITDSSQLTDALGTSGIDTVFFTGSGTITLPSTIENITVTGTGDATVVGNARANVITLDAGDDRLFGYAGNDRLDGGTGHDTMAGGTGNDTYVVNSRYDRVVEGRNAGIETVYSSVNYTLGSNVENLVLTGAATSGTGNSLANVLRASNRSATLNGLGGNDKLYGRGGHDHLDGGASNDTLSGGAGNDILIGGSGDDVIFGGFGADRLDGGSGHDLFVFNTKPGKGEVDRIVGFNPFEDTILLENAVFKAMGGPGTLDRDGFRWGSKAADANDRILYDAFTGALYYDADGSGSSTAVQFAKTDPWLWLTHDNFRII